VELKETPDLLRGNSGEKHKSGRKRARQSTTTTMLLGD